jgi:glycosyltransferase involved in cell wall biosynthesis
MPRIAFLAFYPLSPNRIGGMDRFFWRLDQYARLSGWRITWLFPAGGDHSHYLERGMEIVSLPAETFLAAAAEYFAASPGFDLLVSVFVEYATRYAVRWRRCGVRRYLALDHMSRRVGWKAAPADWKDAAKGATVYPFIDAVIAVCAFVKQDIVRRLGRRWDGKVFAVANGVDTQVFYPAQTRAPDNDGGLHLAVIAHLIEEKGIQVLFEALRSARYRVSNMTVSIAGSGPYEDQLRGLVSDLGLDNRVSFLGATSRQADLLRTADVSIVPSLWAEAFPFSVLESMACGVPVIASRIGGMPEMVGKDAALLFGPGNADELASSLAAVAEDGGLRRRMGEAGVERTKAAYTVEHMLGGYVSVMRHLLAEPGEARA